MAKWNYKLKLKDIFHDETLTFEQRRDEIVKRIRSAPFFHADDPICELSDYILDNLSIAATPNDFDYEWDEFYNWCDANRVWVETF